jgi:hypothetical protein
VELEWEVRGMLREDEAAAMEVVWLPGAGKNGPAAAGIGVLARAGDVEGCVAEAGGLLGVGEAVAAGTLERDGLEMLKSWGDDDETTGRAS